jgi:hypothetical protein
MTALGSGGACDEVWRARDEQSLEEAMTRIRLAKIAIATTTFACTALLSVGWTEQRSPLLSVESAQARVRHPLTHPGGYYGAYAYPRYLAGNYGAYCYGLYPYGYSWACPWRGYYNGGW